jgi:hypothetical protein
MTKQQEMVRPFGWAGAVSVEPFEHRPDPVARAARGIGDLHGVMESGEVAGR